MRQKLVVVIDGTSNDPTSRTNASRLHELISNQDRSNLTTFYTEGVGSDGRVIGMATGWGMAKDVRDAYRFLAENWRPDSDIFIFGFSRGAFGGRVLSGLVHIAGLIRFRRDDHGDFILSDSQRERIVDRLYNAYLHPSRILAGRQGAVPSLEERRAATRRVIEEGGHDAARGIRIVAAGYFDTVAAMGLPDNQANPLREDTSPYLDQFCNVDHVFHAVSLDDNRALDFTPILANDRRRVEECAADGPRPDIREVWFSGAHADVGGAYANGTRLEGNLPGNSLNWMIAQIRSVDMNLLPAGAGQFADPYDMVHDARAGLAVWRARPEEFRFPLRWLADPGAIDPTLRVHFSVAERLERLVRLDARFTRQCVRLAPPVLRCANSLRDHGFLQEMIDHDCVARTVPQPGEPPYLDGYRFRGPAIRADNAPEIRLACVTLAFDTVAQRDEFMAAGGLHLAPPR